MKNHKNTDSILRAMDAAGQSPAPNLQRMDNDRERILRAHPIAAPTGGLEAVTARTPKMSRRRTVALAGFALAATAGFLAVPALSGGDPAFATWTATPGELMGSERDGAVSDCVRSSQGVGDGMYSRPLSEAEVAIAEKRGSWTTVVLTGPDGFDATCTTDASAPWFKRGSFGSIGNPGTGQALGNRGVKATQLGTGVISDNSVSMASGRVGQDIVAVTYTRDSGQQINATVSKGHFAFWFPGAEIPNTSRQAVPVEVTYTDGTAETRYLSL